MPQSCAAWGCAMLRNPTTRQQGITFHNFPKNHEIRQKWIPCTGRKNWTPGLRAVLCSNHFEEACFDRTGQTTRLRAGAIPTLGKFAPKLKTKELVVKLEPLPDLHKYQVSKKKPVKIGITTRSGRQLPAKVIPAPAALTIKGEIDIEEEDIDDPPLPPTPSSLPPPPKTAKPTEVARKDLSREVLVNGKLSSHPDHFYCRTQNEMDTLLKKSEQKIEYLKMKLDHLNSPRRVMEFPDWSQFRRATLQKEAEQIKAMLKAGEKPTRNHTPTSENLVESDEQLRERQKQEEELKRQIRTLQQKNRRLKKRSKAKYIRYVVMIEPTGKSGKKDAGEPGDAVKEGAGEEEKDQEATKKVEAPHVVEPVSSLQETILSQTASMVVGPNGLLDEKDKQIKDLQKKLKIAKHKEKKKTEQVEHLQEVIEMLKEKCPEYSSQMESPLPRQCSLCHSPLTKRCHRVAQTWAATSITDAQVSLPLSLFKPASGYSLPHPYLISHSLRSLGSQRQPWARNRGPLCTRCWSGVKRGTWKGGNLLLECLNGYC